MLQIWYENLIPMSLRVQSNNQENLLSNQAIKKIVYPIELHVLPWELFWNCWKSMKPVKTYCNKDNLQKRTSAVNTNVPFLLHCTLMTHWLHTGSACGARGEIWSLTSGETRWIIVHVCQSHSHRRGARESAHLSHHVLGLDDQQVLVSCLAVHVRKSRSDDPCKWHPNLTFHTFWNQEHLWSGGHYSDLTLLHFLHWEAVGVHGSVSQRHKE